MQRGHAGQKRTWDVIKFAYSCIHKQVVTEFCRTCRICQLKKVQQSQPKLKLIRSEGSFERIQIDLVDMRHNKCEKDGKINAWIAHVIDHFPS